MKKNYKTKSMRLLVTLSLIACLLVGCGNSKAETQPEIATEETTEEVKEEPTAEPETKEDEAVAEETTSEDETVAEETTAEETDSADPGEVTYITDFTSIDDYMASLDSESPAIVIYNEQEGYIINMQEGQHYQLKKDDQVILNFTDMIGYGMNPELVDGISKNVGWAYSVAMLKLENFVNDQEFYIIDPNDNKITCYLAPPTE